MKKLTFAFVLILISISGFGQKPLNAISIEDKAFNQYYFNKANIPVVKGKISNAPEEFIQKVSINYTIVTPLEQFQINKSCKLNPDGTFELELDHAFPYQQIWISVGRLFYAGIYANKDLFIELDAETLIKEKGVKYNGPGIKYLGTDGELNTYMNNHVLFKREMQLELVQTIRHLKNDKKLDFDSYLAKLDSVYAIFQHIDNEFIEQNSSNYSWMVINERQSEYYSKLCVKHWGKVMDPELFEKVKKHKVYLISNDGTDFYYCLFTYLSTLAYKSLNKGFDAYKSYSKLNSNDHQVLDSITQIENQIAQALPFDTAKFISLTKQANQILHDTLIVDRTLQTIALLDSTFEHPKADFLKMKITDKDPNDQKLMTEAVRGTIHTGWCKDVIQKLHEDNLEKLAAINKILQDSKPLMSQNQIGEPIAELPFGAKLYKVDTMKPETLLANLKKTFENKALILDFWATWCGPCIADLPYSKKLHDAANDMPVEFVYLCTSSNSDIEKWKSKIAELQLGGTHIFVDQTIENELMSLFSTSAFPSYVFIDKNGDYKAGAINRMRELDPIKLIKLIE